MREAVSTGDMLIALHASESGLKQESFDHLFLHCVESEYLRGHLSALFQICWTMLRDIAFSAPKLAGFSVWKLAAFYAE